MAWWHLLFLGVVLLARESSPMLDDAFLPADYTSVHGNGDGSPMPRGKRCKRDQPVCLGPCAYCNEDDECVCEKGNGRGGFACHGPTFQYAHIINDPVAYTFGGEHFDLPLPCRYLAASVNVQRWYHHSWKLLDCTTKVHAFNARSLGKVYVAGTDVTVEYKGSRGGKRELHFRAMGQVSRDGSYSFQLSMRESLDPKVRFREDFDLSRHDGGPIGHVIFGVDNESKRAILVLEHCGLEVSFRPAHPEQGIQQDLMPGLAIAYDTSYKLKYLDMDKAMCLGPDLSKMSTGKIAEKADMSPSQAFLWMAIQTAPEQSIDRSADVDPMFNPACPAVTRTMRDCTNKNAHVEAMEMCHFILGYPLFLKCFSTKYGEVTTSNEALKLFGKCVKAFCTMSDSYCNTVHSLINAAGCIDYSYDAFKEHGCHFKGH